MRIDNQNPAIVQKINEFINKPVRLTYRTRAVTVDIKGILRSDVDHEGALYVEENVSKTPFHFREEYVQYLFTDGDYLCLCFNGIA